ncbi:MAG: lipoyl(octanoyl) transferase [Bacteroidetes bacterium QS_8_68_15]|nr:MAG: lipoyl(octanoyl) transferase [Bacteroidetes bacterium QS_8_68_15]
MNREAVVACKLGRVPYEPVRRVQQRVQQRLIRAKRAEPSEAVPHVLLLVEHPPVYTLGKSGDEANLLADEEALAQRGATVHRVGRGGDVTFHGPGQLVAYPILDLDRFSRDLHRYLRALEAIVIQTCAAFGVTGERVDGRTGVWVGPDRRGPERKVCAMGVQCSRWVTMHGLALNLNTDLSFFDLIVPCGIADRGVTSLAEETGGSTTVDEAEARRRLLNAFAEQFEADLTRKRGAAARSFLRSFLEEGEELPALLRREPEAETGAETAGRR